MRIQHASDQIHQGQLHGSVDRFDPPRTVSGWVIDSSRLGNGRNISIEVRLAGKSALLGQARLTVHRPDIIDDPEYLVGFSLSCVEDIPDEAFAFGTLAVVAVDNQGRSMRLPLYDRARGFALERILASAPPFAKAAASALLTALAKSPAIESNAREALQELNDKYFREEDQRIVYEFESLGKDCSLGSVQRAFGAEPLGLWRFAGIGVDGVIAAIETGFAGIGEPEFTRLTKDGTGEFYSSDTRYHMSTRTHIFDGTIDHDDLYRRQCRKIKYLAENMISKLETGKKVFVIHALPEEIPELKLRLLHRAIRDRGASPLLYLRLTGEGRPTGSVFLRPDGIIVGHVHQLQGNMMRPEAEVRVEWMSILRQVDAYVSGTSVLLPEPGSEENAIPPISLNRRD